MTAADEFDSRLRSLEAERLRPVPPPRPNPPSALSRYLLLADVVASIPDDLTVPEVLGEEPGAA